MNIYVWMHARIYEYICECMYVSVKAWIHMYICESMHEHICMFMNEFVCMHGCAYVYEFTYVCGIVCVYMEEELSYRVLGEKNLEKWREGWCWYSAKGWDSGVLRTVSLFLFPFALRRKMGRVQACLGLLCCLSIWCSRFCRDNILELAVSRGPLNRTMGGMSFETGSASVSVVTQEVKAWSQTAASVLQEWATRAAGIYDLMI